MAQEQEEKRTRSVIMTASAWEKIRELADADKRTINAEIEFLVEQAHAARFPQGAAA